MGMQVGGVEGEDGVKLGGGGGGVNCSGAPELTDGACGEAGKEATDSYDEAAESNDSCDEAVESAVHEAGCSSSCAAA